MEKENTTIIDGASKASDIKGRIESIRQRGRGDQRLRQGEAAGARCQALRWRGRRILDPTKVTRLALQNAASVAGLLLTTEVMIADAPKDESEHAHMPPAGGMGGIDMYAATLTGSSTDRKAPAGNCRGFFVCWLEHE